MALRRPAAAVNSRKPNPPSAPPAAIRHPKSALAKSSTSDEIKEEIATPTSPNQRHKKTALPSQDDGSNIQVVVRCRRRSDREIKDGSPVIVTTNGLRGEDVTVEIGSHSSVLGVVTLPPTRTYPFDRVFGSEADQAMVYNDVVAPILDQVLAGYNCTLFAYGQTGTGKTHTMQGDLTPTHLGNPSATAGMIPRVLYKLFQHLEETVDFSVKISYIELYNEELRDLLAPEMTTPIGNAQPMSMGNGQQVQNQSQNTLKIFDDSAKRGVVIQGLEEVNVRSTADALALLTKGTQRRQIAATKFNDHSSRSHSVFSITVHLKETSSLGDDLIKVGKLNLVDLAGSENISRSGAENKRAREAGMINQSLLTLGRVINALVEKSSHIPYRESKLTRLLQDSLGGRTKTCIIATISPAKCNIEETLSTLEYALRAKSIRNKPEVNQRLTKNTLLKEYVAEIERLKADLLAARDMNGIYFSQESWDQLSVENEERQGLYDEAKRKAAIAESQLSVVREDFEKCMMLLLSRESELATTQETLKITTDNLHVREEELEVVKDNLEEEVVVRQAHQKTEVSLDKVAYGLKTVLQESIEDVHALFEKLGRTSTVADANLEAVSRYGKSLDLNTAAMLAQLEEFIEVHTQLTTKLHGSAQQFHETEKKVIETHSTVIDEQLASLAEYMNTMRSGEIESQIALGNVHTAVRDAGEAMRDSFNDWSVQLKKSCETLCNDLQTTGLRRAEIVEQAFKAITAMLTTVIGEAQGHIQYEYGAAVELGTLTKDMTSTEIGRLREQNAMLMEILRSEKVKSERARDEMLQRISGLLGEYAEARNQELQKTISEISQSNSSAEHSMNKFVCIHADQIQAGVKRRRDWDASLKKRSADGENARDVIVEKLGDVIDRFGQGLSNIQTNVTHSITLQMGEMDEQAERMTATCSEAFDRLDRVKRARINASDRLTREASDGYVLLRNGLDIVANDLKQNTQALVDETSNLDTATRMHHSATATGLEKAQAATYSLLQYGTKQDVPTHRTPRKRYWEYPEEWVLTAPRDEVVRKWRGNNHKLSSCQAVAQPPLAENPVIGASAKDILKSPQDLVMDVDVITDDEPVESTSSVVSSASSTSRVQQPQQVHRSTGSNGFGKISKLSGQPNVLRERPTNFLQRRPQ